MNENMMQHEILLDVEVQVWKRDFREAVHCSMMNHMISMTRIIEPVYDMRLPRATSMGCKTETESETEKDTCD